jgi:5-methylcytosine-specific restriction protein A
MAWSHTSRHARGYGTEWTKTRIRILERDNYLCQPCLREGRAHPANEVDHRIPKAKGGTDDDSNLQAIAHDCHVAKTTRENGGKPKQTIGADGWPID